VAIPVESSLFAATGEPWVVDVKEGWKEVHVTPLPLPPLLLKKNIMKPNYLKHENLKSALAFFCSFVRTRIFFALWL
jgi:hypothetical protein